VTTCLDRRSFVTAVGATAAAVALPAPLHAIAAPEAPVLLAFTDEGLAARARAALDDLDIGAVLLDLDERLRRRLPRFGGTSPEAVLRRAVIASWGHGPYDDAVGMGYARAIAQQFAFRPLILRPHGSVEMWFVPDREPNDPFDFYWERPVELTAALRAMRPCGWGDRNGGPYIGWSTA
jgi:hypothetical protein